MYFVQAMFTSGYLMHANIGVLSMPSVPQPAVDRLKVIVNIPFAA